MGIRSVEQRSFSKSEPLYQSDRSRKAGRGNRWRQSPGFLLTGSGWLSHDAKPAGGTERQTGRSPWRHVWGLAAGGDLSPRATSDFRLPPRSGAENSHSRRDLSPQMPQKLPGKLVEIPSAPVEEAAMLVNASVTLITPTISSPALIAVGAPTVHKQRDSFYFTFHNLVTVRRVSGR